MARLSHLLWIAALSTVVVAAPAHAGETTVASEAEASDAKDDDARWWGGTATFTSTLGRGTFLSEPNHEPYLNLGLSLKPRITIDRDAKLDLTLLIAANVNAVESSASTTSDPHEVRLEDVVLGASWSEFAAIEAASLSWSGKLSFIFPASLLSQHATKIIGVSLGISTDFEPLEWLTVSWGIAATKNFNEFDTAVLERDDFSVAPLRRPGGAEGVGDGLTATGAGITEWALSNSLSVEFTFLEDFSALIDFTVFNAWSYRSLPKDDQSSPHAVAGRGRSDVMYGTIEFGWSPLDWLDVSLGTLVEQAPKTADNSGFRFPFWDTTNGAENRQTFYLSVGATL